MAALRVQVERLAASGALSGQSLARDVLGRFDADGLALASGPPAHRARLMLALIEAGVITAEEAERHPDRHVITRAVGAADQFRPDYWLVPMVNGDRLLLCSDGLLRDAPLAEVAAIACAENEAEDAVRRLLELALGAGARDNVSIIVVDVHSQPNGTPESGREFG